VFSHIHSSRSRHKKSHFFSGDFSQQSLAFPAFSLQQLSAFTASCEVGQQGLPQSSPHAQPVQSQASHWQLVHKPPAHPHSVHLQSLPQQQSATAEAEAAVKAGTVNTAAATARVTPPTIFENVVIVLSSLRIIPAQGKAKKRSQRKKTSIAAQRQPGM